MKRRSFLTALLALPAAILSKYLLGRSAGSEKPPKGGEITAEVYGRPIPILLGRTKPLLLNNVTIQYTTPTGVKTDYFKEAFVCKKSSVEEKAIKFARLYGASPIDLARLEIEHARFLQEYAVKFYSASPTGRKRKVDFTFKG